MDTDAQAVVRLSRSERVMLENVLREPRVAQDRVLRINLLLKSDGDGPKWPDSKIAEARVKLKRLYPITETNHPTP